VLTGLDEILARHARDGSAACAVTCYALETAAGAVRAAEAAKRGIVLLLSPAAFAAAPGPLLVRTLVAAAEQSAVPACVQLDHVSDLRTIERAFALGVQAVMADGSRMSRADNEAFTRSAVAIARRFGGTVEAVVGRIEGDEEVATAVAAGALTDPADAAAFVRATGVGCLAVSIGNVHGRYRDPPDLDFERLAAIRRGTGAPLSLHGASGVPKADLLACVRGGIGKVNVNTEVRERVLGVMRERLDEVLPQLRVLELQLAIVDAVADVVAEKLRLLEPATP
jgi:tagatose 1,6-diphosphate aldolase GatY/KbaY